MITFQDKKLYIFETAQGLAQSLASEFLLKLIDWQNTREQIHIALSGGKTPLMIFDELAEKHAEGGREPDWNRIHFYWGDERCVPPDSSESNFGQAWDLWLNRIDIPEENIHRIQGENNELLEAKRYSNELKSCLPLKDNIPRFDWIFLGIGDDGHTASIFPNRLNHFDSRNICEYATHPETGQKRITITGKVINNARRISFLVTGSGKKDIVKEILLNEDSARKYPSWHVKPEAGYVEWWLDKEAASNIDSYI